MKTVEEIIQEKNWSDLTSEEKNALVDLVDNEIAFNEMKQFFLSMEELVLDDSVIPSPSIKSSLDQIYQAKHPGLVQNWEASPVETPLVPLYNRTWFRVAAIVVLSLGAIPFFWNSTNVDGKNIVQVAQEKGKSTLEKNNIPQLKEQERKYTTSGTPMAMQSETIETGTRMPKSILLQESDMREEKIASSDMESISNSGEASRTSYGLDKDLHPFQEEVLSEKMRSQPIATEDFLAVIVASY